VKTRGYVVLTLKFHKQGRRWTALCEELGTATFGRSLPEADQRLKEAILLHINTLDDVGERESFFKEHNIQLHQDKPRDNITVCLPINKEIFIEPLVQALPELSAA
jgi:predicted RNase H-like HicB family nuclease